MKCTAPLMISDPAFKDDTTFKNRNDKHNRTLPIRCGKCEGCLKSKINDWAFRLEQEARQSLYCHFVTLTYEPASVPLSKNLLPTLKKRDVQLYLKRLRKLQGHSNIKYFAVGEYGSTTYRPHYHLLLFNVDERKDIENAWKLNGENLGYPHIGDDIGNGAVPYTLKYMYKKGLVPAWPDIDEDTGEILTDDQKDDRLPEFRLMSQKLGINYLTPNVIKWHLKDPKNRMYVRTKNGFNVAMPRYYREKLIQISGLPREKFQPDELPETFITADDGDYRTVQSRIKKIKREQKIFDKKRQQQNRKKL